ncbi:MAG: hypothetical protein ACYC5Y_15170 [Symbiobacteriia bacterium]
MKDRFAPADAGTEFIEMYAGAETSIATHFALVLQTAPQVRHRTAE